MTEIPILSKNHQKQLRRKNSFLLERILRRGAGRAQSIIWTQVLV